MTANGQTDREKATEQRLTPMVTSNCFKCFFSFVQSNVKTQTLQVRRLVEGKLKTRLWIRVLRLW